jgi:hypothetical protein
VRPVRSFFSAAILWTVALVVVVVDEGVEAWNAQEKKDVSRAYSGSRGIELAGALASSLSWQQQPGKTYLDRAHISHMDFSSCILSRNS